MILAMILSFVAGYVLIAVEHVIKINKAALAMVLGIALWIMYIFAGADVITQSTPESFKFFLEGNPDLASQPAYLQALKFVSQIQIIEHLGDISQILFYLIGAMTIVELIDVHGGFASITNRIKTRSKRKLLWLIALIAFFMSAVLDNLTTSIVMVMLLRKIVSSQKERWFYAGIIIIAANSGGAWTPIGDVTTIMLWINGNVTTTPLMSWLFLPSLVSTLVPLIFVSMRMKGTLAPLEADISALPAGHKPPVITRKERLSILWLGILCLVSVPLFKYATHLPPFMGILLALGLMWIYIEVMYNRKDHMPASQQHRIPNVLSKIDMPTILFFLGILLAVAALQCAGVLSMASAFLDAQVKNIYVINTIIGLLSSMVDNVPLVAGSMAMYPIMHSGALAASADPSYMANFMQDGMFWQLLAYCAGVGGSILIIGSAAGVVVMGLEKMNFFWYVKNITLLALLGYFAGIFTFILQHIIVSYM